MKKDVILFFDGLCEPINPGGTGCWGFVVYKGAKDKWTRRGLLGDPKWMTNNYAEWCALGFGLKFLLDNKIVAHNDYLTILGDSQLVIRQLDWQYDCKAERLFKLRKRCEEILDIINCDDWVCRWIPRTLNEEADKLSREAMNLKLVG